MSAPFATNARSSLYDYLRITIFAAAAILSAAVSHWAPGGREWMALAVAAIAIAIWHGAFDGVLAEQVLRPRYGPRWTAYFYAGYLALAGGVLLVWWWAPLLALVAFLLYSALHFGAGSERELSLPRLIVGSATGFLPIAAACHWRPAEVAPIFSALLRQDAAFAAPLAAAAGSVLWPILVVVLVGAFRRGVGEGLRGSALSAAELLLFRCCSPVAAFAVFFCVWHTPEHMLSTSIDRTGQFKSELLRTHLERGFGTWLLSLAGVAFLCWWGRHDLEAYASAVFLALSALTVPHMVLAEICRRQESSLGSRTVLAFSSQKVVQR